MTHILALETSSAWCSVALSTGDSAPLHRHQRVSAGASQLLLPWVDELLSEAHTEIASLDALAVGVGPGAFTGVRLGVAAAQGLAISQNLPVIPVASLDAIADMLTQSEAFIHIKPEYFMVAIDARMDEVYWAHYQHSPTGLPKRLGDITLSAPEAIPFDHIHFVAGSAIAEFGDRLFTQAKSSFSAECLDAEIGVSALGVLICAQLLWKAGLQQNVRTLEPLYVRNKVAFTADERKQAGIS